MTPYPWQKPPFYPLPFFRHKPIRNTQYVKKIVFLRPDVSPQESYYDLKMCGTRGLKYLKGLHAFIGNFPVNSRTDFRTHPDIFYVEEDIEVKIHVPFKGKILTKPQVIPWGIKRIHADQAWPVTQGKGVRVAILDTGIAFDHPDLRPNVKGGVNLLSRFLPPYDHNGHGTHVAGIVGAVNNRIGVVGAAPQVDLYAVKAFNKDGTAKLSDIIKGIDWCISNKIQIINMSFGFNEPSSTFQETIRRAHEAGIVMIAASGNKGTRGRLEYPAQFAETIAVTSINQEDQISKFSTIGPRVDLAAPGEKIISTWTNNSYRELSGTSMAVAHVTGVAALMLSKYRLSSEELRQFLRQSAVPIQASSYAQGAGVVNASVLARAAVE
ncbi:S8 family peptidase [Tepidibacillus fermentans]|uniref:Subtilase family protein n=1 Tax=Tepidibacillus fermentans TaxID=1281767 RepID=A0A4R3KGA1_9BACI|nr:S8 family peptidase [Tepidibacillus fermentans]TCS82436.1 subtilase family protein [Tepidibacillus fermentans]